MAVLQTEVLAVGSVDPSLTLTEAQQLHNMINNPKVAGRINRRNIIKKLKVC
jgi:hypothetical protein